MDPCTSPLLTDLYQLTMLQGYYAEKMEQEAVFEFFVRKLPEGRNFYIAAGLEQLLDYLEEIRFNDAELEWLEKRGGFHQDFLDRLERFRFTGDVHAMPEGTPFFPNEPIVRLTAPLPEAQLVESRLINLLHLQILIASKAARCFLAAAGKTLVDFGMRRAHGSEAGLFAARACYLAGFSGTATILAGQRFGIPTFGTMAHSYIQAHDDELQAFLGFARANPENVVLLLDTYDTERGARKTVELAKLLEPSGIAIKGVRLDSGDLAAHARNVRKILDDGGLISATIFGSGNLDEYELQRMLQSAAPIDGFGVGTKLDVSADAPYLDCAYKLQEYAGKARRKRSEGKATWPGRKQVFRFHDARGRMERDVIGLEHESHDAPGLLQLVMKEGRRIGPRPSLAEIRDRCLSQLQKLPAPCRTLAPLEKPYPVEISPGLIALAQEVDRQTAT